MTTVDYAQVFERQIRPRRHRFRNAMALTVWGGLFLLRPRLARDIWRERRG
jgi:hypothetical protein